MSMHVCPQGPQASPKWALENEREEGGQDAQKLREDWAGGNLLERESLDQGSRIRSPFFSRVPRTRESSRRTAVPLLGSTAP